jgi:phosphoribosylamine--glycine ligase
VVVGKGGREHALALRLLASPAVGEVVLVPGNAGTAEGRSAHLNGKVLRNVAGDPFDTAVALAPDLVVVGPEAPLCAGLVDRLADAGLFFRMYRLMWLGRMGPEIERARRLHSPAA